MFKRNKENQKWTKYFVGQKFRRTKVTKFSDGDENFVQRKILFDENFVRHCFVREGILSNISRIQNFSFGFCKREIF